MHAARSREPPRCHFGGACAGPDGMHDEKETNDVAGSLSRSLHVLVIKNDRIPHSQSGIARDVKSLGLGEADLSTRVLACRTK